MNVLSLDLEPREDLPDFQGPRWLPAGTPRKAVKVWQEDPPKSLDGFTHLMLSGSTCSVMDDHPFVEPVMALLREAVRRGVPVLGICYGHQLIARALLGREHVRRSPSPEIGWLPVEVRPGHETLFEGLPDPFHTFVGHFDEVCDLPPDWQVIAGSGGCEIQGFIHRGMRLLGLQFHPEMDLQTGNACFAADREALAGRGFDMDAVFARARDDGSGRVLIPRFLDLDW